MSDLRYRTMRLKVYAQLLRPETAAQERKEFLGCLDRMDEDAIAGFFERVPAEGAVKRLLGILREARELGDRLNAMDRTLPVLPHTEIAACYRRLRSLGDEVGDLEASGVLR
jgi:hypothetical protein